MGLNKTEYRVLHHWVQRNLGTPSRCVDCGDTSAKRYHWANISGKYNRDLQDWKRLCPTCHSKFDGIAGVCRKGHLLTEENSYYKSGGKLCKRCQKEYGRLYYHKKYKAVLAAKKVSLGI